MNVTDDRQTTDDKRQTDGRTTTYSEGEREFTFANKNGGLFNVFVFIGHFAGSQVDSLLWLKRIHLANAINSFLDRHD